MINKNDMETEKSLQKVTDKETENKSLLLLLDKVTQSDIENLGTEEFDVLKKEINETLNTVSGLERDLFFQKVEDILHETGKNIKWEENHRHITSAIAILTQEYGRMPTNTEIAIKAKLSRQTIHKHLKEYTNHPLYLEQQEQFRFMYDKVLAKVFQFAVNGDIAAAKLYFNVTGFLNNGQGSNNTLVHNQNNYIQINGTVLSQDAIKQLTAEQLSTIENVLKTTLAQPEVIKIENN